MTNPGQGPSLADRMTSTWSDSYRSDAPPSFMTPLSHAARPTAPVSSFLPDPALDAPDYTRPSAGADSVRVDPLTVAALAADLSSIASAVGGAEAVGLSDSVAAGMPGSDTASSCTAAAAALSSALDTLHSRFTTASSNVTATLETYVATDAANADGIGRAGGR